MTLLGEHFANLKEHADLVNRGIPAEQAAGIVFNADLSAEMLKSSPVQQIRDVLKQQAVRVNILAQNYFKGATAAQLQEVVCQHQHIKFTNPYNSGSRNHGRMLTSIGYSHQKKVWCLYFGALAVPLVDCDIQELLGLLQTFENVVYNPQMGNELKH